MSSSCNNKPVDPGDDFDRATLLTNVSQNIIMPNYSELNSLALDFKTSVSDFTVTPNEVKLTTVKTNWINLYKQWEHCKMFDFGPAMDHALLRRLNSFPSDTVKIEDNITAGSFNLDLADQTYAQGLPAFDYLLFHKSDAEVIAELDVNRKSYMNDLAALIQSKIQSVTNEWETYQTTFNQSTSNDASSSTSLLVNEMNKDFERIKNLKFKFPLGIDVLQMVQAKYIETRYSKNAFILAKENTTAIKNLYTGTSQSGSNGIGFDDYLIALGENGTLVNSNTTTDFNSLIAYFDNYSGDIEEEMNANYNQVNTHFELYHGMVYHLKSELPSAISILITYQDNDGD
jgi:predicted lipoprotein